MSVDEETVIKCVRCPCEFVAGEVASTSSLPRGEIIAMIIGQLGWKRTFAGWQCPHHAPIAGE